MRMDEEVVAWNKRMVGACCRCELHSPECDAVGSTAVVAVVTPQQIVVANCGDSRAVLCRNGQPVPLSYDYKPDSPEEKSRIQAAGGRVIYWEGPRPYVICDPDVTVMERTKEDDCLILASDGLWDAVSNDTACSIARMCLKGKVPSTVGLGSWSSLSEDTSGGSDGACLDASTLLTKLALTRRSEDNGSLVVIDLRKDT
ncbi:protein phosphatase [Lithospermum erythrorhizon]|uniref:Protein phosphatase n=1 Tax=Lithospermum erythrorhizon TaxID=34254 RepID=A0AAV3NXC0_LITER